MDKFNYLVVIISTDGGMGEDVAHMLLEGRKVLGTMAKRRKENLMSRELKRGLHERVLIPTVAQERRKIEVYEMACFYGHLDWV